MTTGQCMTGLSWSQGQRLRGMYSWLSVFRRRNRVKRRRPPLESRRAITRGYRFLDDGEG